MFIKYVIRVGGRVLRGALRTMLSVKVDGNGLTEAINIQPPGEIELFPTVQKKWSELSF